MTKQSFTLARAFSTADKSGSSSSGQSNMAQRGSFQVLMEPGKTYLSCTCGQSKQGPWCDGSQTGTDFKPFKFTYEGEAEVKSICGCEKNRDGSGGMCDRSTNRC